MIKYQDGTVITKDFKDMSYEEIFDIDISTLDNDEDIIELFKWRRIKEEEHFAPLNY